MAAGGVGKEVKGRTHTYYQVCKLLIFAKPSVKIVPIFHSQVLIDGRDSPYITHRCIQCKIVIIEKNHCNALMKTGSIF